jgi:hypothetical protein
MGEKIFNQKDLIKKREEEKEENDKDLEDIRIADVVKGDLHSTDPSEKDGIDDDEYVQSFY